MKLSDWAKKQGIAYLTAYRWFKDNKLPVKAYQSDSGTIIVEDESENLEQSMVGNTQSSNNDVMSLFLKKTVEFSKNNASVEEFAAYVLSNFSLKLASTNDSPKYSKIKPKSEDVQKHFKQFLRPNGDKPKPSMFVADVETLEDFEKLETLDDIKSQLDLQNVVQTAASIPWVLGDNPTRIYDSVPTEGVIIRSAELTPQNYTSSSNFTFGANATTNATSFPDTATLGFVPTQKELAINTSVIKQKRGRKPSKSGNNI